MSSFAFFPPSLDVTPPIIPKKCIFSFHVSSVFCFWKNLLEKNSQNLQTPTAINWEQTKRQEWFSFFRNTFKRNSKKSIFRIRYIKDSELFKRHEPECSLITRWVFKKQKNKMWKRNEQRRDAHAYICFISFPAWFTIIFLHHVSLVECTVSFVNFIALNWLESRFNRGRRRKVQPSKKPKHT